MLTSLPPEMHKPGALLSCGWPVPGVELRVLDAAEVAVTGVPDPRRGEAAKSVVVLKPGAEPDAASIIAWARARIGGFKVAKSADLVAALPRNATGKVLRRALREPYWVGERRREG